MYLPWPWPLNVSRDNGVSGSQLPVTTQLSRAFTPVVCPCLPAHRRCHPSPDSCPAMSHVTRYITDISCHQDHVILYILSRTFNELYLKHDKSCYPHAMNYVLPIRRGHVTCSVFLKPCKQHAKIIWPTQVMWPTQKNHMTCTRHVTNTRKSDVKHMGPSHVSSTQ